MYLQEVCGTIAIFVALAVMLILVLWGRRTINDISRRGPRSAREILRRTDDAPHPPIETVRDADGE